VPGVVFLLAVIAVPGAEASRLLVAKGGYAGKVGYGWPDWTEFTAAVDSQFDEVLEVTELGDLDLMLSFDALLLDQRGLQGQLSQLELANLGLFVSTGRRVTAIGENFNWGAWNSQILSVVGGTFTDGFSWGEMAPVLAHQLTSGVSSVWVDGGGTVATGDGAALFDQNFATLWDGNYLTVLDTNLFMDPDASLGPGGWEGRDNGQFGRNIAAWLAVPEPSTGILLSLAFVGLALAGRPAFTGRSS